eukprot:Skav210342  [mRNA]  locus=scaffold4443:139001:149668:- [translate_table: standard]
MRLPWRSLLSLALLAFYWAPGLLGFVGSNGGTRVKSARATFRRAVRFDRAGPAASASTAVPGRKKPLLLFLPGIDGAGRSASAQFRRLRPFFDCWTMDAGDADAVLPSVAETKRLQNLLPGAQRKVLRGVAHACFDDVDNVNLLSLLTSTGITQSLTEARSWVSPVFLNTAHGRIVRGLPMVDPNVPLLLVGNHQLFSLDGIFIVEEFLREQQRPRNLLKLLQPGGAALLFPGGAREVFKRKGEEYQLFWPDTPNLVRLAAKANATIIPFSGVGSDEHLGVHEEVFMAEYFRYRELLASKQSICECFLKNTSPGSSLERCWIQKRSLGCPWSDSWHHLRHRLGA